jgi:type 1 glutamine amidotransferase
VSINNPRGPFFLFILGLSLILLGCAAQIAVAQSTAQKPAFTILVFAKTAGFRHDSIPAGVAAIQALGNKHNFHVHANEEAIVFSDNHLARYRCVVFLNTTGDILDSNAQAAFERFIRRGGGFVGIHAAADTEYAWPWYGKLMGAYFDSHPAIQTANLKVVDATHASTKHLPPTWRRRDEWYNFRADPSANVNVLIQIDESTYSGGKMGASHPISWYHRYDGGRAWYTALGHTSESYQEELFLRHLLGGIRWAAGATPK